MRKKIFTFLLALVASVGMSWADTYVTITQNDFPETGHSFTKDGVTVSAGYIDSNNGDILAGTGDGSFSTTLGNFTKIEVEAEDVNVTGEGWSGNSQKMTWTGNASSVSFGGEIMGMGNGVTLKFTIGDPLPTYTVALKAGTANANKVTLSATSAIEGATITVTPDEEYEITAFKAKYNTTEEAPSTLDPATGAYRFTMPAFAVTIEATIALKPVPEGDIFAGFTATAGSGGFNNEGHANLVDNKFTSADWTKWCADNSYKSVPTGESGDACWWIDFEASEALNPTGYILTTGNDTGNEHGRNPKNWVLKAKLNAGDAWTTIATVTNDVTMKNKSFKDYKFFVDQSGTYQYFRFEVFANQGANVMQLCELRLIGAEPQLAVANTLQLHVNDAAMGSVALQDPSNDIFDFGDGTYAVPEGATVTLIATPNEGYEFTGWKAGSVDCDFTDCGNALPTNDNPLTFDMNNEVAFMAEFAAVAPADNSVKLYNNFSGEWADTEAFGIFDDYTSEYAKISMILEPGDYQFALKVGGELRGDGTAFSRNKRACILGEGLTANLTLNVDVKGTYRFYWFYDENRFAMDVPNVCGMYWKDVTAGNFEVTLGQEGEVTLPTVFTTNMGFASNIFNGVDQVRLGSTDETVATIAYTLSLDGLGTITIHKAGECDIYVVHDITDYYCYDSVAFHLTVLPAQTPQPQIGPKEVLDLGTTGCVGEHYQLTGGGTNIYRTVGGVDNKAITIESLHGEIIDNISLKLYYYNVWTGYSVAASSGDVSSWNYDAYEDLVITNINATSVTLSRVGSGQANGYVMFEKVTINNSDEPQPQPAEDVNITPYVDPDHAGVYYSTFFDSSVKYELPAGVEAYVADLSGANLLLTKIAEAGEVIPANVAVILKSTVTPFTLTVSDADAVTFTATNDLQGSDTQIATPANCYVLAGNDGVGFYHYTASMLNPHKAYVIYSGSQAPKRMPFIFDQATGVESVQPSAISSQKVIENGQLFIIKNGVKYNAQGQVVK